MGFLTCSRLLHDQQVKRRLRTVLWLPRQRAANLRRGRRASSTPGLIEIVALVNRIVNQNDDRENVLAGHFCAGATCAPIATGVGSHCDAPKLEDESRKKQQDLGNSLSMSKKENRQTLGVKRCSIE